MSWPARLQMDPIEFRLKNRLREGDDLCSAPNKIMSTVWLEEAARAGAEKIGWQRRSSLPAFNSGARKRGMGVAMVIHSCGSNPGGDFRGRSDNRFGGRIRSFSGTADQGSEQQTTLAPDGRRSSRCIARRRRRLPTPTLQPVLSTPDLFPAALSTRPASPLVGRLKRSKSKLLERASLILNEPRQRISRSEINQFGYVRPVKTR